MGRRALRKIDPALDLSGHFKTADELPRPFSAAALFGREVPLEIEVGSGKGMFLASAAQRYPEHNFLGIEIAAKYARFAAARLAKNQIAHAMVVAGDAVRIFRELLPDAAAFAVHVYFPDPWWKKRHRRRRVMNVPFIQDVERVLVPEGTLHFWTDVEEYFQSTLELIAKNAALAGPLEIGETQPEHDLDYRTHFERRMRLGGEPIYRALFRKPPSA